MVTSQVSILAGPGQSSHLSSLGWGNPSTQKVDAEASEVHGHHPLQSNFRVSPDTCDS